MRVLLALLLLSGAVAQAAPPFWQDLDGAPAVSAARQAWQAAGLAASAGGWTARVEGEAGVGSSGLVSSATLSFSGSLYPLDPAPSPAVLRAALRLDLARRAEVRRRLEAWHAAASSRVAIGEAEAALAAATLRGQSVAARLAAGAATALAVEEAALNVSRAELALAQARRHQSASSGDLGAWTELPVPPTQALGLRPDVLEAQLSVRDAEDALRRAQRDARPSLTVSGQLAVPHLTARVAVESARTVGGSLRASLEPGSPGWSLGLRASVPLGPGPVRAVQAAELQLTAAQASLKAVLADVDAELSALRAGLEGARAELPLAQQALDLARRTHAAARERFVAGRIGEADLKDAERGALRAELDVMQARARVDRLILDLWDAQAWWPGPVETRR